MKLMLTSAGITNSSLARALKGLVGEDMKIAFIPTAANNEKGNKDWLIKDFSNCLNLGSVDIVDISALEKSKWLPRLEEANVIFVGGGDTTYLMGWIIKSGLIRELPRLLKNRVYVGISAGSIVLNKTLSLSSEFLYGDEDGKEVAGLGYVDFYVRPHLNSPYFPKVKDEFIKPLVEKFDGAVYAIDDNSAVVFNEGDIKVVSEGKWIKYS
jgi:dipeptidase E